tara:strand:- start:1694 stop:3067 length:1374 start_codon:yes stop_codon:yes gene_type:complete
MSKIQQKQELRQKLNPKQILEASLFQLNSFALEQRIYSELEKNPLLELSEPLEVGEDLPKEDSSDFEVDELYSNTDDFELSGQGYSKQDIIDNSASDKKDQLDFLKEQIKDLNLGRLSEKIAYDIIDNLDQKGYMAIEPILIADRFNVDLGKVSDIQRKIRLLDPPGIGSVDIRECLLSQLEFHNYNDSDAYNIIFDYFEDFSKANYDKISKNLSIDKEKIRQALDILSNLYLYPADNTGQMSKETIIPDLFMEKRDNKWVISINDSSTPELVLNEKYSNMMNNESLDKKAKIFIKNNHEKAHFFISAIKQRNITMIKVMESILFRQTEYFESDKKILIPMILKDIAQDIDMDISTISRICNGKYVQLPWGIFELRFFFNEGIKMQDGTIISSSILKDEIIAIINNESLENPLKDEQITKVLNDKGYDIARRTVSKYRDDLNIPSSLIRKRIKGLNQ